MRFIQGTLGCFTTQKSTNVNQYIDRLKKKKVCISQCRKIIIYTIMKKNSQQTSNRTGFPQLNKEHLQNKTNKQTKKTYS